MRNTAHSNNPLCNSRGKARGIVVALILAAILAGGGYWFYHTTYRKAPLQPKLYSLKINKSLIHFTHDHVSTALYHNLIMTDDIVVMMDKELKRLKRIEKKFPNQRGIVSAQTEDLEASRRRMATALADTTANIEKIYVTWLVDRPAGTGLINSQKGTLTRHLADAIRGEAVLIGRIRSNSDAAS